MHVLTTTQIIVFLFITLLANVVISMLWMRKQRKPRLLLSFISQHFKVQGDNMALTLLLSQQASGQVQPVDKNGKPAQVEADSVNYSTSNPEVFEVVEDPNDETKFTVVAKGVGTGQLTVSADANLGEGVKTIETFSAIEVFPDEAVGFGITFGEPEDQPQG